MRNRLGFTILAGLRCIVLPITLSALFSGNSLIAEPRATELKLDEFLRLVLERNESLQGKLLDVEINRRKARSELGVFEPALFGSASREANKRENTAEQESSQLSDRYEELNNIYQGGIESLLPTGAKVRLGYTLRDLNNSLQGTPILSGLGGVRGGTNGEYQTFFGVSLSQPLLKNAWYPVNLAAIRLAALGSDIAFQDYRRQLMIVVSTAEASYWNLFMAQEQVRYFHDSVLTAQKILNDNRDRLNAGKGSELEVLESEAALALRQSKLSDAEQKLYEASNRVISLYAESVMGTNRLVRAVDQPKLDSTNRFFFEAWKNAFDHNPDFLSQRHKVLQESVRLAYAKNQRLPELDLKTSYGLNGLGETPGLSWDDVQSREFPSWSIGIEMRIPLAGDIKGRNDLAAARLREKQALIGLQEIRTQIVGALDNALHKITSSRDGAHSYEKLVSFNRNLLETALARLEVGKTESRKVLDIEADLFEARNSMTEALVLYQRAVLELELVQGVLLKTRSLELTQKELENRTTRLLVKGQVNDEQIATVIKEIQQDYATKLGTNASKAVPQSPVNPPIQVNATNQPPTDPSQDFYDKLRDATRKQIEELNRTEPERAPSP